MTLDESPAPILQAEMAAEVSPTPRAAYEARLAARHAALSVQQRRDRSISNARVASALTFLPLAWAVWGGPGISAAWFLAPIAAFVALVVIHGIVDRAHERARIAVRFYRDALARLDGKPVGSDGAQFANDDHPYAADLDLFGPGSLFALLCTARTHAGERALADWLMDPAETREVLARQAAVRELRPNVELREDLAALAGDVRAQVSPGRLLSWATSSHVMTGAFWLPCVLLTLAAAVLASAAGWSTGKCGPLPFVVTVTAVVLVTRVLSRATNSILDGVEQPSRDLVVLARTMERFTRERFLSDKLVQLWAAMGAEGFSAPRQVLRLSRLIELADVRRNQLLAPIAYLLLWSPLCAWRLEGWRRRCGPHVGAWLSSVGELEALASLAAYAFDHPEDTFPQVVEDGPLYEAVGLSHPLLPEARGVRNDLSIGAPLRLVVVSGSNMSGKSTLLRSVGTSVAMALAGCPVRARALRLSPLRVGASLCARDSLQAGSSRFYAEIRRIRQIVRIAEGGAATLFLFDEILSGTNSHDRRQGSDAVLQLLVARGALGLVTSHDLALAEIVPTLGDRATNMHFVDRLEGSELVFDYTLRPGILQKSNAVALMRAIGLPV